MLGRKEVNEGPTRVTSTLSTDESGAWGIGGVFGHEWLSIRWRHDVSHEHIL